MGGEAHHGKKRGTFVQRTIDALAEAMERSLYAEHIATQRGVFQQLDARTKLISALAFIAVVATLRSLPTIIGMAMVAFALVLISGIAIRGTMSTIWLGMAIFSGMLTAPAIFIVPGPTLFTIPWLGWGISANGLRSTVMLMLRAEISITVSFVLITTTLWTHVLKALRILGVPTLIVVMLSMTYRYIFLMLQSARDLFEARQSRIIGKLPDAEARRLAAGSVGVLLSKSVQLSNDVFMAMQSRGFRGEVYTLDEFRFGRRDAIAAVVIVAILAGALWFGVLHA